METQIVVKGLFVDPGLKYLGGIQIHDNFLNYRLEAREPQHFFKKIEIKEAESLIYCAQLFIVPSDKDFEDVFLGVDFYEHVPERGFVSVPEEYVFFRNVIDETLIAADPPDDYQHLPAYPKSWEISRDIFTAPEKIKYESYFISDSEAAFLSEKFGCVF